ncbi:MAG TPA: LysR family transcriptional regulator [Steroidobacteraceae bacterium]|nr:LysR family transcriptional regulator [Steroidobacteraceae bacterium]
MDFVQLKRFIAVVEAGSFGKAAESLNLSQPGLSKSIQQLEAHFKEPLFYRGTKGVTATELGKAVYRHAKRVLAEWHHLENEHAAISGGLTGHITVGVARGTGFLGRVIPAASAKLSQSRYSVRLTVVSGVAEELVPALQLGELDFAIAPLDAIVGKPDLVGETLFYDRCGLFVDANHPLTRVGAVSIEQLAKYCWLYSTDVLSYYHALCALAHSQGVEPRKTTINSNSVLYLSAATVGSEFIGILSMDSVEDQVIAGKLVEVVLKPSQRSQVATAAVERPVGFLMRADAHLSQMASMLQKEIYALCPKLGYPLLPRRKASRRNPPAA